MYIKFIIVFYINSSLYKIFILVNSIKKRFEISLPWAAKPYIKNPRFIHYNTWKDLCNSFRGSLSLLDLKYHSPIHKPVRKVVFQYGIYVP